MCKVHRLLQPFCDIQTGNWQRSTAPGQVAQADEAVADRLAAVARRSGGGRQLLGRHRAAQHCRIRGRELVPDRAVPGLRDSHTLSAQRWCAPWQPPNGRQHRLCKSRSSHVMWLSVASASSHNRVVGQGFFCDTIISHVKHISHFSPKIACSAQYNLCVQQCVG